MLNINNLEIGKLYVVYTKSDLRWIFKKTSNKWITGCSCAISLKSWYVGRDGTHICDDNQVVCVKPANENHIAIWNRTFNDNIEMV